MSNAAATATPPQIIHEVRIIDPNYFELTKAFYLRAKQGFNWTTTQQRSEAALDSIDEWDQRRESTFVTIPRISLSDLWRQTQHFYSLAVEAGEQERIQKELGIENLYELKCEARDSLIEAAQNLFRYYQDLGGLQATTSSASPAFHTLTQIQECMAAAGLDINLDSSYKDIFVTTKMVDGEPTEHRVGKEEFDLAFTMAIPELPVHKRAPV